MRRLEPCGLGADFSASILRDACFASSVGPPVHGAGGGGMGTRQSGGRTGKPAGDHAWHGPAHGRQWAESLIDHLSVGLAEFYAVNRPIRIEIRFRRRVPDDHPNQVFAAGRSLPDGFRDRQFKLRDGHRNPVIPAPPLLLWRRVLWRRGRRLLDRTWLALPNGR